MLLQKKKYKKKAEGGPIADVGMWTAIAGATTQAGDAVKGNKSDFNSNYIGNMLDTDNVTKVANSRTWLEAVDNGLLAGFGGVSARLDKQEYLKAKKQQERADMQNYLTTNNPLMAGYDMYGSNANNIYAEYGGTILPIKRQMSLGGNLEQASKDNMVVKGNSHAEGGVKFPASQIELEGEETVNTGEDGSMYVFSDKLGMAKKHKKLIDQIAKVEKRPYNAISANTLKRLKGKEEQLKLDQEALKYLLASKGKL